MKLRAILLALASLPVAGRANAQEAANVSSWQRERPTRILLVASPRMDELGHHFTAELASLRFEVVRFPESELAASIADLELLAEQQEARVAVRLAVAGAAVDVWVVSPTTHEVVYRRVVPDRDPAVAVLRALEILRGALMDLGALAPAPSSPAASAPPPPLARALPPKGLEAPAGRLSISLAGAVLWPQARRELGWGTIAAGHYTLDSHFQVRAAAMLPIRSWTVEGQGGQADASVGSVLVAMSVLPWGKRTLTPSLGLGVGALALHVRGRAQSGFRGTGDGSWSAFPHAHVAATLALGATFSLRAEGMTGFATPRPVLLFAEERQSSWINPLFVGSLGLEVAVR